MFVKKITQTQFLRQIINTKNMYFATLAKSQQKSKDT